MDNTYRYGWIPDSPDHRDTLYAAPTETLLGLPEFVDLSNKFPPVYNQGNLGSCTANGIGAVFQFERSKQGLAPDFIPSRLFIYYNERVMEGTINSDNGAMIRDGIKSVVREGACSEEQWPYNINRFQERPPKDCYEIARNYRAVTYYRIDDEDYAKTPDEMLNQMKGCLAEGHPFVFGFTVYESFNSDQVARTGVVPMPSYYERPTGGHCVVAVGYDDKKQCFKIRNSWGEHWGDRGYCTMPYAYLSSKKLSDDFWTIRLISHLNATG